MLITTGYHYRDEIYDKNWVGKGARGARGASMGKDVELQGTIWPKCKETK